MDAATIARVMSAIPERQAWAHGGSAFAAHEGQSDELRHLAPFLHWLSPLGALSRDDQRALGLLAAAEKPSEEDDDPADFDPDATLPPSLPPAEEGLSASREDRIEAL